jgi:hypothetical protein
MATIVSVRRLFRQTGCNFVAIESFIKEILVQKITPFLWYDGQAEEAVNFYVSVFKNSKWYRSRVTETLDRDRREA